MFRAALAGIALAFGGVSSAQMAGQGRDAFLKHPGSTFVLENARLIDGTGGRARERTTIVVQGGVITSVGRLPRALPADAKRIDLTGHTVLPGLVMMHEHINYFSGAYIWDAMPGSVPNLLLAAGVTTARTAGAEAPQIDLNLKKRIDSGRRAGPRFFVTGGYLNDPSGGFLADNPVRTAEEARDVVAFWARQGATSIKVYSAISPEALRGAVDEANRHGIHVAGHLGETGCGEAADAGIHTIEHALGSCLKDLGISPEKLGEFRYEAARDKAQALITRLVARKVVLVTTPAVTETFTPSAEELGMLSPDQLQRYERMMKERPPWMPSPADLSRWNIAQRAFERDFVAAGGRLLIGGDAMDFGLVPGYANHNAIISLVRAGFPPEQVIRFASSDAAGFLGIGGQIGTVAPGRVADLLIVKGAPDRRIDDIRNVTYVFKDGLAFDPDKLRAAAKGMLGQH